jgi:hypothetical protein
VSGTVKNMSKDPSLIRLTSFTDESTRPATLGLSTRRRLVLSFHVGVPPIVVCYHVMNLPRVWFRPVDGTVDPDNLPPPQFVRGNFLFISDLMNAVHAKLGNETISPMALQLSLENGRALDPNEDVTSTVDVAYSYAPHIPGAKQLHLRVATIERLRERLYRASSAAGGSQMAARGDNKAMNQLDDDATTPDQTPPLQAPPRRPLSAAAGHRVLRARGDEVVSPDGLRAMQKASRPASRVTVNPEPQPQPQPLSVPPPNDVPFHGTTGTPSRPPVNRNAWSDPLEDGPAQGNPVLAERHESVTMRQPETASITALESPGERMSSDGQLKAEQVPAQPHPATSAVPPRGLSEGDRTLRVILEIFVIAPAAAAAASSRRRMLLTRQPPMAVDEARLLRTARCELPVSDGNPLALLKTHIVATATEALDTDDLQIARLIYYDATFGDMVQLTNTSLTQQRGARLLRVQAYIVTGMTATDAHPTRKKKAAVVPQNDADDDALSDLHTSDGSDVPSSEDDEAAAQRAVSTRRDDIPRALVGNATPNPRVMHPTPPPTLTEGDAVARPAPRLRSARPTAVTSLSPTRRHELQEPTRSDANANTADAEIAASEDRSPSPDARRPFSSVSGSRPTSAAITAMGPCRECATLRDNISKLNDAVIHSKRETIAEVDRARKEVEKARQERSTLEAKVAEANTRTETERAKVAALTLELDNAQKSLRKREAAIKEEASAVARAEVTRWQEACDVYRAEVEDAMARAERAFAEAEAKVAAATSGSQATIARLEGDLAGVRVALESANNEMSELASLLVDEKRRTAAAEAGADDLHRQLREARALAEDAERNASKSAENEKAAHHATRKKAVALKRRVRALESDLEASATAAAAFASVSGVPVLDETECTRLSVELDAVKTVNATLRERLSAAEIERATTSAAAIDNENQQAEVQSLREETRALRESLMKANTAAAVNRERCDELTAKVHNVQQLEQQRASARKTILALEYGETIARTDVVMEAVAVAAAWAAAFEVGPDAGSRSVPEQPSVAQESSVELMVSPPSPTRKSLSDKNTDDASHAPVPSTPGILSPPGPAAHADSSTQPPTPLILPVRSVSDRSPSQFDIEDSANPPTSLRVPVEMSMNITDDDEGSDLDPVVTPLQQSTAASAGGATLKPPAEDPMGLLSDVDDSSDDENGEAAAPTVPISVAAASAVQPRETVALANPDLDDLTEDASSTTTEEGDEDGDTDGHETQKKSTLPASQGNKLAPPARGVGDFSFDAEDMAAASKKEDSVALARSPTWENAMFLAKRQVMTEQAAAEIGAKTAPKDNAMEKAKARSDDDEENESGETSFGSLEDDMGDDDGAADTTAPVTAAVVDTTAQRSVSSLPAGSPTALTPRRLRLTKPSADAIEVEEVSTRRLWQSDATDDWSKLLIQWRAVLVVDKSYRHAKQQLVASESSGRLALVTEERQEWQQRAAAAAPVNAKSLTQSPPSPLVPDDRPPRESFRSARGSTPAESANASPRFSVPDSVKTKVAEQFTSTAIKDGIHQFLTSSSASNSRVTTPR